MLPPTAETDVTLQISQDELERTMDVIAKSEKILTVPMSTGPRHGENFNRRRRHAWHRCRRVYVLADKGINIP